VKANTQKYAHLKDGTCAIIFKNAVGGDRYYKLEMGDDGVATIGEQITEPEVYSEFTVEGI